MTEKQAYFLDAVVGCLLTWGSVVLLNALGINGRLQALVGMIGLVATCFMVGVIGEHYRAKREAEGKVPKSAE